MFLRTVLRPAVLVTAVGAVLLGTQPVSARSFSADNSTSPARWDTAPSALKERVSTSVGAAARDQQAAPAHGVTYYVAVNGRDSDDCSSAKPCASLQRATSLAHPGDTVVVLAGTYGPQVVEARGTATDQISVRAQGSVTLTRPMPAGDALQNTPLLRVNDSSFVTVSGLTLLGMKGRGDYNSADTTNLFGEVTVSDHGGNGAGVVLENLIVSHSNFTCIKQEDDEQYETIRNNMLTDCGAPNNIQEHGIYLSGGHNTVSGNVITNVSGYGIHTYQTSAVTVDHETIVGNTVRGAQEAGIYVREGPSLIGQNTVVGNGMGIEAWPGGMTIQQNVVAKNTVAGLSLHQDTEARYSVLHNTFYQNGREEIGTAGSGGMLVVRLENNIFYGHQDPVLNGAFATGSVVDYNDYFRLSPLADAHPLNANPLFLIPGVDFHLAADSPAIGVGAADGVEATGVPRLGAL